MVSGLAMCASGCIWFVSMSSACYHPTLAVLTSWLSQALSVASLQGDEGGGLRGAHARTAVLDGLVGDRELREVLADPKSGTASLEGPLRLPRPAWRICSKKGFEQTEENIISSRSSTDLPC